MKKLTVRQAVNAKCKECIYDPIGGFGNWRQQVGACTSYSCPLYEHRPVSKPRPRINKVCGGAVLAPERGEIPAISPIPIPPLRVEG